MACGVCVSLPFVCSQGQGECVVGPQCQMLTQTFYSHALHDAIATFAPAAEKPAVFIRHFEEEELVARRLRLVVARQAAKMGLPVDNDYDMGGMWRIRRLYASVVGFYKVLVLRCPCALPVNHASRIHRETWTLRAEASGGGDHCKNTYRSWLRTLGDFAVI